MASDSLQMPVDMHHKALHHMALHHKVLQHALVVLPAICSGTGEDSLAAASICRCH